MTKMIVTMSQNKKAQFLPRTFTSSARDVLTTHSVLEGDQRFEVDYSRGEVLLESSSDEDEEPEELPTEVRASCL